MMVDSFIKMRIIFQNSTKPSEVRRVNGRLDISCGVHGRLESSIKSPNELKRISRILLNTRRWLN